MEDNNKIKKLIERLIESTKNKEIKWDRLFDILDEKNYSHTNQLLNKFLFNVRKEFEENIDTYRIDYSESFVTEQQKGYIFIFTFKDYEFEDQYKCISVQSSLSSNVVLLNNSKQYQAEIKRLVFLIEEEINNVDGFIDSLLD